MILSNAYIHLTEQREGECFCLFTSNIYS